MLEDWKKELETEVIASMGELKLSSKTITLISGQSMAGKTATCIHFVDSAIKQKKRVLYIDTDKKSIMARPEPNLFKTFYNKNKELYDQYFLYTRSNELDDVLKMEVKPELLVIDSLYNAYLNVVNPKERAARIKEFLSKLRDFVWENEIATVITTPVGTVVANNRRSIVALGGEGIKYLSDVKVFISFPDIDNSDEVSGDKRFFVIDRQHRYAFTIEDGGFIKEVK